MLSDDQESKTDPTAEIHDYKKLPKHAGWFVLSQEAKFPLALIGIALLIWIGTGMVLAGAVDFVTGTIAILILLAQGLLATIVSVLACFLVAALFGTAFGEFKIAVVKLAASTMFPLAIALIFLAISPWLSGIAVLVLSLSLLKTFFDLDIMELTALVLVESMIIGVAGFLFDQV